MRPGKALALGDDPEKVPDVAQVLVRFSNGERKGRRFESIPRYRHCMTALIHLECLKQKSIA
ncbi:hypothetical protein DY000_02049083 [Brassica cretica]|uniref:Uncharacterized protein n=1 Tax=Brassica cretica TaxID=69181 RepID=A0ABQ7ENG2_BRACR|nr:hypothetical protein DY000_02049083 [Brassica cretica]